MPLWVSDFLGDTLDLDAAEIGAYMLLLMAQWQRGGDSLPNDQSKLKRVARCGRNWPKVWGNLSRYFDVDDAGVYSQRLRLESQNVAAKREVNARNGALGGKAKALKSKDQVMPNATDSLERNPSIPEPEPYKETTNVVSAPKRKAKRACQIPDGWVPNDRNIQDATDRNFSQMEIDREADKFRNYCQAHGKTYKDWNAAWRNWLGNARKYNGSPANATPDIFANAGAMRRPQGEDFPGG